MVDKHNLTVPGRFDSLAEISNFIMQAARDAGFDEDDVFHIQMAVDEACTNIVEHAYGQGVGGDIDLSCRVTESGEFCIDIRDYGKPFDPGEISVPHIDRGEIELDDLQAGGLGLFFMRKLMDEVTFHFDEKAGNHLTMVKRRPQ